MKSKESLAHANYIYGLIFMPKYRTQRDHDAIVNALADYYDHKTTRFKAINLITQQTHLAGAEVRSMLRDQPSNAYDKWLSAAGLRDVKNPLSKKDFTFPLYPAVRRAGPGYNNQKFHPKRPIRISPHYGPSNPISAVFTSRYDDIFRNHDIGYNYILDYTEADPYHTFNSFDSILWKELNDMKLDGNLPKSGKAALWYFEKKKHRYPEFRVPIIDIDPVPYYVDKAGDLTTERTPWPLTDAPGSFSCQLGVAREEPGLHPYDDVDWSDGDNLLFKDEVQRSDPNYNPSEYSATAAEIRQYNIAPHSGEIAPIAAIVAPTLLRDNPKLMKVIHKTVPPRAAFRGLYPYVMDPLYRAAKW